MTSVGTIKTLVNRQSEMLRTRAREIYVEHMRSRVPPDVFLHCNKRLQDWYQDHGYCYDIITCKSPGWTCGRIRKGNTVIAVHFYKLSLE